MLGRLKDQTPETYRAAEQRSELRPKVSLRALVNMH